MIIRSGDCSFAKPILYPSQKVLSVSFGVDIRRALRTILRDEGVLSAIETRLTEEEEKSI